MMNEDYCQICGRPIRNFESIARGMGATCEEHVGYCLSPFVIVIDSNEQQGAYKFEGITEDARRGNAIIIPQIETKPMYRDGLADYSIIGMETEIQIERKSLGDFFGSITHRRNVFEREIENLNEVCTISFIVIEAEWRTILFEQTPRIASDEDKALKLAKMASRTHDSWMMKYPSVHWVTCAGRVHAEQKTYRLLEKFWRRKHEK